MGSASADSCAKGAGDPVLCKLEIRKCPNQRLSYPKAELRPDPVEQDIRGSSQSLKKSEEINTGEMSAPG